MNWMGLVLGVACLGGIEGCIAPPARAVAAAGTKQVPATVHTDDGVVYVTPGGTITTVTYFNASDPSIGSALQQATQAAQNAIDALGDGATQAAKDFAGLDAISNWIQANGSKYAGLSPTAYDTAKSAQFQAANASGLFDALGISADQEVQFSDAGAMINKQIAVCVDACAFGQAAAEGAGIQAKPVPMDIDPSIESPVTLADGTVQGHMMLETPSGVTGSMNRPVGDANVFQPGDLPGSPRDEVVAAYNVAVDSEGKATVELISAASEGVEMSFGVDAATLALEGLGTVIGLGATAITMATDLNQDELTHPIPLSDGLYANMPPCPYPAGLSPDGQTYVEVQPSGWIMTNVQTGVATGWMQVNEAYAQFNEYRVPGSEGQEFVTTLSNGDSLLLDASGTVVEQSSATFVVDVTASKDGPTYDVQNGTPPTSGPDLVGDKFPELTSGAEAGPGDDGGAPDGGGDDGGSSGDGGGHGGGGGGGTTCDNTGSRAPSP